MPRIPYSGKDTWGRRPKTPFQIWLYQDPKRAASLSMMLTVGLILFWISVVIGLVVFILLMVS